MPNRPGRKELIPHIEARFGAPIRDLLVDRYYHRRMTLEQIAEEFEVTASAVSRWMKRFGLPTREWVTPPPPEDEQAAAAAVSQR